MRCRLTRCIFLTPAKFVTLLTLVLAGFALSAVGQTPVTLYDFSLTSGNVGIPNAYGVIAQGRDGNLYSATPFGGALNGGGVYSVTPAGTESVVYSFPASYTNSCRAGLTLGNDGNLYGDCSSGGPTGQGLIYQLTPAGVFTDIHDFTGPGGDGATPNGPPVWGKDGNLYGTTDFGGSNGNGTVYKLTPSGTMTLLHSFKSGTDGNEPDAPLVQGKDGAFYGSTYYGGANNDGVIFKITPAGVLTVLHNFNVTDGKRPLAALVQGRDGNFYGTTYQGGANGEGVVFKITPSGTLTVLHDFSEVTDGIGSQTAMVQATDGNFYGTTNVPGSFEDTLFKITPAGVFSIVYHFDGISATVGVGPVTALVQNTNGILYGATLDSAPAVSGDGTIYSLDIAAKPFARLAVQSGIVGSSVGIFGQGFGGSSVVKFAGVTASGVVLQGTTYMTVPVPAGALTGNVTVTTGSTTLTSSQPFKVLPRVKDFRPPQGPVGTVVTIRGQSLTQTTKVSFGGVAATTFTVNSDTQITATVPTGAVTGKISVATAGGSANSTTEFTVQ